jgi:hypothetical protein
MARTTATAKPVASKAKTNAGRKVKKSDSSDDMPRTSTRDTKKKGTRGDGGKKKKGRASKFILLRRSHASDPNAPKRGLSAYMFFANEQRDTVREENPGISFGQVGKVLGDKWKALSEKQREPYEKKAAADKKRYEEEKAKYNVCATT